MKDVLCKLEDCMRSHNTDLGRNIYQEFQGSDEYRMASNSELFKFHQYSAIIFLKMGDNDTALSVIKKMFLISKTLTSDHEAFSWLLLSNVLEAHRLYAMAVKICSKAYGIASDRKLKLDIKNSELRIYARQNDVEGSRRVFETILNSDCDTKNRQKALHNQGLLEIRTGNTEKGATMLEKVISLRSGNTAAYAATALSKLYKDPELKKKYLGIARWNYTLRGRRL